MTDDYFRGWFRQCFADGRRLFRLGARFEARNGHAQDLLAGSPLLAGSGCLSRHFAVTIVFFALALAPAAFQIRRGSFRRRAVFALGASPGWLVPGTFVVWRRKGFRLPFRR